MITITQKNGNKSKSFDVQFYTLKNDDKLIVSTHEKLEEIADFIVEIEGNGYINDTEFKGFNLKVDNVFAVNSKAVSLELFL